MTSELTPELQQFLMRCVRQALERHPRKNQAWLAANLDVSQKHLSFLLTGKSAGSIQMWNRIFDALEIKLDVEEAKV